MEGVDDEDGEEEDADEEVEEEDDRLARADETSQLNYGVIHKFENLSEALILIARSIVAEEYRDGAHRRDDS